MNVFILDRNMEKSAQYLDDAHLKAQINEGAQILMANYNRQYFPEAKIGHVNHPVTKYYYSIPQKDELLSYLPDLFDEYLYRFKKEHQNYFWFDGFTKHMFYLPNDYFIHSKTYVNGNMTDDIEAIRHYIMTKPHTRPLTWTNREKPDWWEM